MPDDPSVLELGPFEARKVTAVEAEDWLRIIITLLFSLTLITFLGFYLYYAVNSSNDVGWQRIKEAFGVILPAVTGTLGTVIGFYFGKGSKS